MPLTDARGLGLGSLPVGSTASRATARLLLERRREEDDGQIVVVVWDIATGEQIDLSAPLNRIAPVRERDGQ